MADEDEEVSLLEFLQKLREDIERSQNILGEANKEAMFRIDKIDLEARIVVKKEVGAKAGVQLYFVTVGGGGKYGTEETHVLKLSFSPIGQVAVAGSVSGPPPS